MGEFMENPKEIDFFSYLGDEEENLLKSIFNFNKEIGLLKLLDDCFQIQFGRFSADQNKLDEVLVATLFMHVHSHYYICFSQFLRCHLSMAYCVLRIAIDACLAAYHIIKKPEDAEKYIEQNRFFLFIKRNIEKALRKNPDTYPKAINLINLHDICSSFGSHADVTTLVHRLDLSNRDKISLGYFQFPGEEKEFGKHFLTLLKGYLIIFEIFSDYVEDKVDSKEKELEEKLDVLRSFLKRPAV